VSAFEVAPGVRMPARAARALPDPDTFAREGWALVPGLFTDRTVERLRVAVAEVVALGGELEHDAELHGAKFQVQSRTGRPQDGAIEPGALRKVTFPRRAHRAFAVLEHDPRLLHVARALGVERPTCAVDQINLKALRVGTGFPLHQDLAFLGRRNRAAVARWGGVNALVALDEADEGNGAFEVVPGSHRSGLLGLEYDLADDSAASGRADRVVLRMAPGDAAFFSPLLLHGSAPNRSERPRRMLAFWFVGRRLSPATEGEPGLG
jgi:phytanoyl-CoA hydroxylase